MKTQLLCIIFAILIGLTLSSCQEDEDNKVTEYIKKNWRNFIIHQGGANKTTWGFDIGKSTLKDESKTLVGTAYVSIGGVNNVLEYQFHLAKCGTGPTTDLPRRGRVSINGQKFSPLSSACSRFSDDYVYYNEFYPRGGNIHQAYSDLYISPAYSKNTPLGFEISFDTLWSALGKSNSSSTQGYYHLDTTLRVVCAEKGVQDNQRIYSYYTSTSSRTVYVTLTHWSVAACPIAVPTSQNQISGLFFLVFLLFGACFAFISNVCVICAPVIVMLCICCSCFCLLSFMCCCCCCCFGHNHHHCKCSQENQVLPQYSVNVPPELHNLPQPVPPAQYLVAPVQPVQAVQPVQVTPTPVQPEKKEERKVQQVNVTAQPQPQPQQQFIEMQPVVLPAPQTAQPLYYYDPRMMVAYPQQ